MSIENFYNAKMNVYTVLTDEQSATGGIEEEEILKHKDVPCMIEIARATERTLLGREGVVISHMIYAGTGKEILEKDRIKVGSIVFDVQSCDDVCGRGHHYELSVLERR